MRQKVTIIILVALGIVVLIALAWWWFLRNPPQTPPTPTGTFGSAQNKPTDTTGQGAGQPTNIGTAVGGETSGSGSLNTGTGSIGSGTVGTGSAGGGIALNGGTGSGGVGSNSGNGTSATPPPTGTPPPINGVGGTTGSPGTTGVPIGVGTTPGISNVPGVVWVSAPDVPIISGTPAGRGFTPANTVFNPTPINGIRGSNPQGGVIPQLGTFNVGPNGLGGTTDSSGLAGSLIGAGLTGAITCSGMLGSIIGYATGALGLAGGTGVVAIGTEVKDKILAVPTSDDTSHLILANISATSATNAGLHSGDEQESFLSCIARTIAKATLQQITSSVVNWINSGFNGTPSFVQNPTQFFQNTADTAAAQFIQGSALSFLCSPFQLQIKIAIAQSYANRNNAQSCTLSQIAGNITNFMNGDFSQGGWGGLLSFTTVPTNNPYGAFAYASVGLNGAIAQAVGQKQQDLTLGQGFLSFQEQKNCKTYNLQFDTLPGANPNQKQTDLGNGEYRVCDLQTTTPGHVIADALGATEKSTLDELTLAKSFDEIISALISQLMTKTLQQGLSNLSNSGAGYASNFYTPSQQQGQSQAQGLLLQMQADTTLAQQYAGVEQGSIQDIESVQSQMQNLVNCWSGAASSTNLTADQQSTAAQNATGVQQQLTVLTVQITPYNNNITRANAAIATLEQLQSRALSAATAADAAAIASDYQNAKASGQLITQADITTAQQNRTTLQVQMAALGQQTSTELSQCRAFGQ